MIGWSPVLGGDGRLDDGLPPVPSGPLRSSARRSATEIPLLLAVAVIIAVVVKTFVAQAFFIPSGSMEPQLDVGDRIVVSRLSYRLHDVHRGDVVVFDSPLPTEADHSPLPLRWARDLLEAAGVTRPREDDFVKRVIGLPGETVDARDGVVRIDGRPLVEPYLAPGVTTADFGPVVVPAGHLFVMGDNRGNSTDARVFGPIPESSVIGRAILTVWPPDDLSFL